MLDGQMVSPQRQLPGGVFAAGRGVKREFEVACLADKAAVGRQYSAVGIGDREAKFAGAILRADDRDAQQEHQSGDDDDKAQIILRSQRAMLGIVYSGRDRRRWTVALRLSGGSSEFGGNDIFFHQ